MKATKWAAAALATTLLVACAPPPSTSLSGYRAQMVMSGVNTTADSYNVYGGTAYTADRAIDGNPDTEWASRDGAPSATLTLQMPFNYSYTAVRIKAQPTQGSTYVLESSDDGSNWTPMSGQLSSSNWSTEMKPVQGTGRYFRVRWMKLNSNLRHWSVFEIQPLGSPLGDGLEG